MMSQKAIVEKLISIIQTHKKFDSTVKWGRLTFALDKDFDHWICAISASKQGVSLKFHFGSLLNDKHKLFAADTSKFTRKMNIKSDKEINKAAMEDLLDQALKKLDYFKQNWRELAKQK